MQSLILIDDKKMQSLIFSKRSKLLFDIEYFKKNVKMIETSFFSVNIKSYVVNLKNIFKKRKSF